HPRRHALHGSRARRHREPLAAELAVRIHVGVAALPWALLHRDDPLRAFRAVRPLRAPRVDTAHARVRWRARHIRARVGAARDHRSRRRAAGRDELSPRHATGARQPDAPFVDQRRRRIGVAVGGRDRCAGRRLPPVPHDLAVDRRGVGPRNGGGGSAMNAAPALSLVGIEKRFGATPIIRGVSLDIPCGERHAIIGPNGAGKSTLFNLISGRFAPTRGSILLDGTDVAGERPYAINRRGLSRSFQVTNIFPRMSVFENLRCAVLWSLGYRYCFWRNADARARAPPTREELALTSRRNVPAGVLTYAEQRALEIGITIAGGAKTILLDEPTAGMSRGETDHAVALMRSRS